MTEVETAIQQLREAGTLQEFQSVLGLAEMAIEDYLEDGPRMEGLLEAALAEIHKLFQPPPVDLQLRTPEQVRTLEDPQLREQVARIRIEVARGEWKQAAAAWSAVRSEAVLELKSGRTWAEVAELLGVSEPTAWNVAHPKA